jgi:hypothetical protein
MLFALGKRSPPLPRMLNRGARRHLGGLATFKTPLIRNELNV